MERENFLDSLAARLGRARPKAPPERAAVSAPWPLFEGALVPQFIRELQRIGGTWERAGSVEALVGQLSRAIGASGKSPSVAARRAVFEGFGLDTSRPPFDGVSFWGDDGGVNAEGFRQTALAADLGITTAVCGIASTGTLLLTASEESPRSVSLLPRRHLAVIRESQLVPDLETAITLGARATPSFSQMPSALLCITGPSRTSDIENDLSIGVHGPEEVHVILFAGAEA